jgi:phage protein D
VLIDGIVTNHQVAPSNDPGKSTLTITGSDLTVALDYEEKNASYENLTDSVIFTTLIASYAQYGLVPQATVTTDVPLVTDRIPRQQETDLKFIQRMAERNGFVFYIEPVTFGVNTAYFGPEPRTGTPQPALSMNMGASTNIDSLSFSQDGLAAVTTVGTFTDPITKLSIPIPSLPSLKIPPLVSSPATALRTVLMRDTSNQNAGQAATSAVAALTNAPDAVTAEGQVDTVRYGSILRARKLVGVRGVGLSYDGYYCVQRVSTTIESGKCSQSFSISREGTKALLPVVTT